MRCLLHKTLLDRGFFPASTLKNEQNGKSTDHQVCNYSWSGQRKTPSYLNKLVFPEAFLTALRTISMEEDELSRVSSLLEEVKFGNIHFPFVNSSFYYYRLSEAY